MPTRPAILRNVERLLRNVRAGTVPTAKELPHLCADWSELLADVDDAGLDAAVANWLRGDCPFWPTPGQILAATPAARLLAAAGGDVDTDAAWDAFRKRMRILHRYNPPRRDDPARQLDVDGMRNTAMFAAMASIGGAVRYYDADETDPHVAREWKRAYSAVRKQQAADPAAGAAMIAGVERRLLAASMPTPEAK